MWTIRLQITAEGRSSLPIQILRDLRGLRVDVVHPPDADGSSLIEHLRRIGCAVSSAWPAQDAVAPSTDIVLLSIDHESRDLLHRLLRRDERTTPTVIAIVGYENPSTLQLVLESGAHAVIERPIRPFGLLTQLVVGRSLWLKQQESNRKIEKLERKLLGIQKIQRAKSVLMANQGLAEDAAYQSIRKQAMSKRISMEDMAGAILDANELLNFRSRPD